MTTPAVGIDFGTSTTLVASPHGVVPIGHSRPWLPSVAGYDDAGVAVAGEAALELPETQLVRSVKRVITERRAFVTLDTLTGPRDVRADELVVAILREAVSRARAAGVDVDGSPVRLGCPAMWDGAQRRRLVGLAQRAGLPVSLASLIDEPVAAGIAWLANRPHPGRAGGPGRQRVVVVDMGGGTLDIAVLDVDDGGAVSVLAALGVAEAGDALDEALAEDLEFELVAAGVDLGALAHPARARVRLAHAARLAKVELTTRTEVDVFLSRREFGISSVPYTRDQLDVVFAPQLDRAAQLVLGALRAARLTEPAGASASEIARTPADELVAGVDVVVLAGGMSQIPAVAGRLRELFGPGTRVELAGAPVENAVVTGLTRAGEHGRFTRHRPSFDVLLEWGSEARTVYEAFTPLVEPGQILRGETELRYARTGHRLALPEQGTGLLRVVSYSGEAVRATLGGGALDGFPVALSGSRFEFALYPDGRIRLTDGAGTHDGSVQ